MLTWPNALLFVGWLVAGYLANDRRQRRRALERALERLARAEAAKANLEAKVRESIRAALLEQPGAGRSVGSSRVVVGACASAFRRCGWCQEPVIPFGVDWPFWIGGRPVCESCHNTHHNPPGRTLGDG